MTTFAQAARRQSTHKLTENGAQALNTTGSACLDLFGSIGSLRSAELQRVERLFADAYQEDPLLATRCLFYARDIRGGLGERATFRKLLYYCALHHPEAVVPNIPLIGSMYGRYDDLYTLLGTPLEAEVWKEFGKQLHIDIINMKRKKPISLLGKWLKTPDASSQNTKVLGIATATGLGLTVYDYKRKLRALRKYLNIVECKMSANDWASIEYASVPARAMMIYRKAFGRHDQQRFGQFIQNVQAGKEQIHAGTLFPYDLVEKYEKTYNPQEDPTIEAQWKALPNYLDKPANCIVMADTSGSMTRDNSRPMYSSVALAVYFAERNRGAYHNLWMSFSSAPQIHRLQGETLLQKLQSIERRYWTNNTNLEAAFKMVLDIGIQNHVAPEDMVKSIIVVSDMEIDEAQENFAWTFYDNMRNLYRRYGYDIPNIVFWNVYSRNDTFHADKNRKGVQCVSGQSASTFRALLASIGMTPVEMMKNVLNSERYQPVLIGQR